MLSFLVLSSALAADPLDVARAIDIIVREGDVMPPRAFNKTVTEGNTSTVINTTMYGWGVTLVGCKGYENAGIGYITVLDGAASLLVALAEVPSSHGGTVVIEAVDARMPNVSKLDGKVDELPDMPNALAVRNQQRLLDNVVTCLLTASERGPVAPESQPLPDVFTIELNTENSISM
ncbi:MAG: hypothetical protein UY72_C0004G0004 [Candidatus Uhrbacteria bacterium GW2011_GWD2_52_7]|uniref:Uncharacterized protein n=1 Tax=Candidatus Uhrbacteria bacterium GW2011_GWD2_52_7 TaxID=1618989 RepID=A0A0G1XII4_9BACT|nr:MAG: hypothetical protein UY72_C0004G0004 [Candidatus Uhrbacteria bacterium GW2011_GWD2_52_7]